VTQAREYIDLIRLDLLPWRASVARLPPTQVGIDRIAVEDETCGQTGQDRDERRTMRFPGGGKTKAHACSLVV
jgi:hypothetical protein